jgi:hypothetical protein
MILKNANGTVERVAGTTCKNCSFSQTKPSVKVSKDELNEFGGLTPTDKKDIANQKGGVITMPGKNSQLKNCGVVSHQQINQYVTERMWCNFWNVPGTLRSFTPDK